MRCVGAALLVASRIATALPGEICSSAAAGCSRDAGLTRDGEAAGDELALLQLSGGPRNSSVAAAARPASAAREYGTAMAASAASASGRRSVAEGRRGGRGRAAAVQLDVSAGARTEPATFRGFYEKHRTGRGVWKWDHYLEVYQRHFGGLAGHPVSVAEVGVQSGGSILMWQAVLGPRCRFYGLDINKACMRFSDEQTSITIGDQADPAVWKAFFSGVSHEPAPKLDILVDDGGHEPEQMMTTLKEVFSRLQPGGFIAIEDIHGQDYIESFFVPAAAFIAEMAANDQIASVHVYPFMLIVHKAGKSSLPSTELFFDPDRAVVNNFASMWEEVSKRPGSAVVLQEPSWGPFLTSTGLQNFFAHFGDLHAFQQFFATPQGCEVAASSYCRTSVHSSPTQALISGVHIYSNYLIVEMPVTPPVLTAVRKGSEWISYS